MTTAAVALLRSLGYGAMFGGGICGLAFCLAAARFSPHIALTEVVLVGGLIGAGLHQIIDKLFDILLKPLTNSISYYSKLAQLTALQQLGLVEGAEAHKLTTSLTERYFAAELLGTAPRARTLVGARRRLPAADE